MVLFLYICLIIYLSILTSSINSEYEFEMAGEESSNMDWFQRGLFIYFSFPEELQKSKPNSALNTRGNCKECSASLSGQVTANGNFDRHFVLINFQRK